MGASASSIWLEILWHRQRATQPTRYRTTVDVSPRLSLDLDNRLLLDHVPTDYQISIELCSYVTTLPCSSSPGLHYSSSSNHACLTLALSQHSPPSHWHSCHNHRRRLRRSHYCHRMSSSRTPSLGLRVLSKAPVSWGYHLIWSQRRTHCMYPYPITSFNHCGPACPPP